MPNNVTLMRNAIWEYVMHMAKASPKTWKQLLSDIQCFHAS
jgi:hypothetical protein